MSVSVQGKDACVLLIQNDSEHDVISFTIELVGYTEDGKVVNLYREMFDFSDPGIQSLTWSGKTIASGSSISSAIPCDASTFSGVRVIISDYTAEDGTVYKNELTDMWRAAVEPDKATLDLDEVETIPSVQGDVNSAGLREVEKNDDSPVRIIDRKILLNWGNNDARMHAGIIGDEADLCAMTVENTSGQTVTGIQIYYIGYDSSNNPVMTGSFVRQFGVDYTYQILSADELDLASGATAELYFPCNWEELAGICMIVSEYTTEDGTVHANPSAEKWAASYNRTTILD
ncbi:MAG: DUF5780 domain-containing protein [Clostridia bacterium]|nr:DUF5780 domain-containing protein [Clostridia bacterium]